MVPLGYSVGEFFAGTFGLACYPLFAFIVFWGLLLFLDRPLPKPVLRVLGVVALVLVLAVFLAGNGTRGIMARTPHSFGGLLGQDLAPGLQHNFGGFGAGLLLLVAGVVAFLVATDWPLHAILADVRSTLDRGDPRSKKSKASKKAKASGPRVGSIVRSAFAKTGRAVLDLFGPATPPSVADEEGDVATLTPKRKRRRVEEEPEEELEDDEEEYDEDEEEYDEEYEGEYEEDDEEEYDEEDEEADEEADEDEEEEEETPRERRARLRRERAAAAAATPKSKPRRTRRKVEEEDHSEAEAAAAELVAEGDEAAEAEEAAAAASGKASKGKGRKAKRGAAASEVEDDAADATADENSESDENDENDEVNNATARRVPNERARAAAARTARQAAGEDSDSGGRAVMPVHIVGIASTEARKRKETLGDYKYPGWELLEPTKNDQVADELVLREQALRIERRLRSHNVEAKVVSVSAGPAVTVFELELAEGTRVTTIPKFAPDLAAALKGLVGAHRCADSRQAHGRRRSPERTPQPRASTRTRRAARSGRPQARDGPALPRTRCCRQAADHRPRAHAALADRGCHGIGQVGLHQLDPSFDLVDAIAGRLSLDLDRPEDGRAADLREGPAPALPGRHLDEACA